MEQLTPPRHIIIVGGGTAGWMAANLMSHHWRKVGIKITLVESSKIGTLGVGEGSTPFLKDFFQTLGIKESQWMPECNATFKCGIRFPDWCVDKGHTSYFHPFYSDIDNRPAKDFFANSNTRRKGVDSHYNPDDYFITSALANNQKAPKYSDNNNQKKLNYGYHFDAELLGHFLKKHALNLGVNHIDDKVSDVILNNKGDIALINTENHGPLRGDLFIDCSGFQGLLIQKALGEEIISCEKHLFNNSAVAIPTLHPINNKLASETISKALKNGWVWHIPLMNRLGNGYVYSSKYCSKEQAEAELRELLGDAAKGQKALHLHWKPGRIQQHWKKNCVAIGLSQGFLEPLEAPMLYLVQRSIEGFIEHFSKGAFSSHYQQNFNSEINNIIDATKDYLQAHYKINSRTDTQYWQDSRNNPVMSKVLSNMLDGWLHADNFDEVINTNMPNLAYLKTSWYCLFSGKNFFSPTPKIIKKYAQSQPKEKALNTQIVNDFSDHKLYLNKLYHPEQ